MSFTQLTCIIAICWLLPTNKVSAQSSGFTTYYVKAAGGDGDGLSDVTAWNYAKLNATHLAPGTTVLFKANDKFYGSLKATSGTPGNPITYSSYGTGDHPMIHGLSLLTAWKQYKGSVYYATINVPEQNVVLVDGKLREMGRYPKTGYLTYSGHSGNNSINSSSVLPFDPVGAEVVIRKIRQITDRHVITSYTDKTIGLASTGAFNTVYLNNTSYQPTDGNGFFIQSSLSTLTALGDWYYDKVTKRLYMHFGSDTPKNHVVKVSTVPVLCQMDNISSVTFQDIDFEGANREIINSNNCNEVKLINSNFRNSYGFIAANNGMTNFLMQGGSVTNMLNSAVCIPQSGENITIDHVVIDNIGTIPGAGGSGDAMQLGIWMHGANLTVRKCYLTNIGYHGIVLYGNNTLCERNSITMYGLTKDDCGGIYEFQLPGVIHKNKVIQNNIILNGIGVSAGAPWYEQYGKAAGIYLDANVTNVTVKNNILAHGDWGGIALVGIGENNQIINNLTYDFSKGLHIYNFDNQPIRQTTVTGNTFIARNAIQATLAVQMYAGDDLTKYGNFDKNMYARPVDDTNSIAINREYAGGGGLKNISVANWKSVYSIDLNSSKSPIATTQLSDLRFEYNNTDQSVLLPLAGTYWDILTVTKHSSITLPAYSGIVLIKDTASGSYKAQENR